MCLAPTISAPSVRATMLPTDDIASTAPKIASTPAVPRLLPNSRSLGRWSGGSWAHVVPQR